MANTNQTVTVKLIVAADGALQSLDRFDKEMGNAANASVQAGAAVDAFNLHLQRMRKAQEDNLPVLKARAQALEYEQRVLQNAVAKTEPIYKAQIAAERELGRVVAAASNMVVQGKLNEAQAIQQLMAIEDAHAAGINRLIDTQRGLAGAIKNTRAELEAMATAERLAATSSDGQSMWNAYAGVSEAQNSARESARVFEQELDKLEEIARLKAEQAGKAFGASLDSLFPTAVRKSARDSASVFETEFGKLDDIARMKATEAGAAFQAGLNASFGIGRQASSAAASASVFEQAARDAEAFATRVASVKAQIDPAAAALDRYNKQVAEYAVMMERGALSTREFAQAQLMAKESLDRSVVSITGTANAIESYNLSSSRNVAQSANIAAQFQDVAVSAQMGMNPMVVALQQGSQLSAVFLEMEKPLRSLPRALMSLVGPTSLLTIGFVALATYGIQWLMNLNEKAEDAETALERHVAWLDKILVGYKANREAAERAMEATRKLPQASVEYETNKAIEEAQKQYIEALTQMETIQKRVTEQVDLFRLAHNGVEGLVPVDTAYFDRLIEINSQLTRLDINANTTGGTLAQFDLQLRKVRDNAVDEGVKQLAIELLGMTEQARDARSEVIALRASLVELQNKRIQVTIEIATDRAKAALEELKALAPDLRSPQDRARDAYNEARSSAPDQIMRDAAQRQYEQTLSAIAEQERRQAAEREIKSAAKDNPYKTALENMAQQTAMLEAQALAYGKTEFEASKLLAMQELRNAATEADLKITPELLAQIDSTATAYAEAELALLGLHTTMENRSPWEVMMAEVAKLNEMMAAGAITSDVYFSSLGKLAEKTVLQYTSAASGILGQVQSLTDGLNQQEIQRIQQSGMAADQMAAALEQQAREQFEINKKISLANAVVAGGEAIVKSYNWGTTLGGPAGGALAAGVAAAATAAQIAAIASSSYQSKTTTNATGNSTPAVAQAAPSQAVNVTLTGRSYSRDDIRELLEQIGGALKDGMTLNVTPNG